MNLIGNFTALVTPFNKNKTIDYICLKNLCEYQINNLSDGIVALGSTAEATTLDVYEKHKVMEKIVETTNYKLPVIAGINAFTLSDALYQSEARFLDGASALLISPPPYIKPTKKGLLSFFTQIADHSYIPIVLYNIPARVCINLQPELVFELSKHPNIIGLKDAGGDIVYTQTIINLTKNNNFSVLVGNDNQLLPALSVGASGIISVAGNIIPDILHKIIFDFQNNNINEANNLYFKYIDFINCLSLESNPIPIKYVLNKFDMAKPYYREPLTYPTNKTKQKIDLVLNNVVIYQK